MSCPSVHAMVIPVLPTRLARSPPRPHPISSGVASAAGGRSDSLVRQAPNVWFRPLCLSVSQGYWVNLLKVTRACTSCRAIVIRIPSTAMC